MTVFKTFFKIVNKYKIIILLYTVLLIVFAGFNMQTSDNSTSFVASKPNVLIVNKDEENGITKSLQQYIEKNCNIIDIEETEEARNDALFYRDVDYIVYIPKNYSKDFMNGLSPKLQIKSAGTSGSSYAEMILTRYIKVANLYQNDIKSEEELVKKINQTLEKETKTEVTSKLDTTSLAKATFYYNFLNYSILAGCVYVICLILSSFREEKIRKRTVISSMNNKKINTQLLISNGILAIILWLAYVILSFVLIGNTMFSYHGLILIVNSFVFTLCSLTIAFFIANLVNNKNAINGIVNVVGLGSSFLCGAFVPVEMMPDSILKVAHILPSYWYIQTNELVKTLEVINFESLKPIITNMGVIMVFMVVFVILSNIIFKKKRKIA